MNFRTVTFVGVGLVAAGFLYQLQQDERVQTATREVRQTLDQISAAAAGELAPDGTPLILRGAVRVLDGRTITFLTGDLTVQLAGIDVCDRDQWAHYDATPWPCGTMAVAWLVSQTLGRAVECQRLDRRFDGTIIGRCGVDGADIAGEALLQGQALVADGHRGGVPIQTYRQLEQQARNGRVGIWSSTFTPPEEWRRDRVNDRATQVRQIEMTGRGAVNPDLVEDEPSE